MDALPVLTSIATDAIRRQFAPTPEPDAERTRPAPWRVALAALLDRAARAVAPVGPCPAPDPAPCPTP